MYKTIITLAMVLLIGLALSLTAVAQPTQFTYQGKLDDNGSPANGNYDFEFTVFDVVSGGAPVGPTITFTNVAVSDGIFSITINSGTVFNSGANRFFEIGVRPSGGGAYTTLNPRQPVTSAPYSIRSKSADTANTAANSAQLGGVAAGQYVVTTDPRLSDSRTPVPGSGDYVQNSNTVQATSNFNISGTGKADILSANTQFNLGTDRFIHVTGLFNTFVGFEAGQANSGGLINSFFGYRAGRANTSGDGNSFFGASAGKDNTFGNDNTFFGSTAGAATTTGTQNTFVGSTAGINNLTGEANSFFGYQAGSSTTGNNNSFFGSFSGMQNISGSNNTTLGAGANVNTSNLTFATAIGSGATVIGSNVIQLGKSGRDVVRIGKPNSAGSTAICLDAINTISLCSSSIRYKSNIRSFDSGLVLIRKLRPVSFNWTDGGMPDLGLVAEDVAKVEPLLTTKHNGKTEGVKYDRVGVVLVNAVVELDSALKRQEEEIGELESKVKSEKEKTDSQAKEIDRLRTEVDQLKAIVCETKPEAAVCVSTDN